MRTLQEKYNGIQEGKFSKEHFLAEARMQQPQLITRFNGYDDAVQILKNKGMIVEGIHDRDILSSPHTNIKPAPERSPEEVSKDADGRSENILRMRYYSQIKDPNISDEELRYLLGGKGVKGFGGTPNAIDNILRDRNSNQNGLREARLTKNSLTDYRYKPTNEMDKYPYEQILRGIRVELEGLGVHGTPTAEEYSKALVKVSKNLAKDSIFYTNLVAGVNPKVDLHDKMVPVTAKNSVDTFNGMKKAELKEGFKKLIKKVLSENMGDMFGDEEREERRINYRQPGDNDYDVEDYRNEDEMFEMQEPKSDSYYKNELADYLDDNGIFGYTDRIHSIMTGPDEAENVDELVRYLEDNQIYGYNRGIEKIYADYPYDQHWMNQPDEDQIDESKSGELYTLAQESNSLKDFLIAVKNEYPEIDLRQAIEGLKQLWDNRGEVDEELYEGKKSLSELLK